MLQLASKLAMTTHHFSWALNQAPHAYGILDLAEARSEDFIPSGNFTVCDEKILKQVACLICKSYNYMENCLLHSIALFDYQSVHGGGPHL